MDINRKNQQEVIMCKVIVTVKWIVYELFNSVSSLCPGEEPFYHPRGEFDPPDPLYSSTEYQTLALDNSGVLYSDHFGQSDVISEFPIDSDSSADWEFSFPVLESDDLGGRAGETKLSFFCEAVSHTKSSNYLIWSLNDKIKGTASLHRSFQSLS